MINKGDDNPQQEGQAVEQDLISRLTSSNGISVLQDGLSEKLPVALERLTSYFDLARASEAIDYEDKPSFNGNGDSLADYSDLAGLLAIALAHSQGIGSVQSNLTKIMESHGGGDPFNDKILAVADGNVTQTCKAALYNAPGTTNSRYLVFAYGIKREEDNLYIVFFEIGRESGSHSTISYAVVRKSQGTLKGTAGMVDLHGHITDYFGVIGLTRRYLLNPNHPVYSEKLDGHHSLKELLIELTQTKTKASPFST